MKLASPKGDWKDNDCTSISSKFRSVCLIWQHIPGCTTGQFDSQVSVLNALGTRMDFEWIDAYSSTDQGNVVFYGQIAFDVRWMSMRF